MHDVAAGHEVALGTSAANPAMLDVGKLLATRLLIQAGSGGGKSWLLRRLLEQTHGMVRQIVNDPEGELVTLVEQFDYTVCTPDSAVAPLRPGGGADVAQRIYRSGRNPANPCMPQAPRTARQSRCRSRQNRSLDVGYRCRGGDHLRPASRYAGACFACTGRVHRTRATKPRAPRFTRRSTMFRTSAGVHPPGISPRRVRSGLPSLEIRASQDAGRWP